MDLCQNCNDAPAEGNCPSCKIRTCEKCKLDCYRIDTHSCKIKLCSSCVNRYISA